MVQEILIPHSSKSIQVISPSGFDLLWILAGFAMVREGLRVRPERAESVGRKIGGRECRGVA